MFEDDKGRKSYTGSWPPFFLMPYSWYCSETLIVYQRTLSHGEGSIVFPSDFAARSDARTAPRVPL